MAPSGSGQSKVIQSQEDLFEPLYSAMKPRSQHRIGAEAEKVGLVFDDAANVSVLPYEGEVSVLSILEELSQHHGWAKGEATGPLISLLRGEASVTLEPGGQLELSGSPLANLLQVDDEMRAHLGELDAVRRSIAERTGKDVRLFGVGFHPLAARSELPWVPKSRYAIMKRYLPTKGEYALDMMQRTATVQANYDYENEAHAMKIMRVGLKLSPFVTAMFANSPFYEGADFGGKSFRAKVWLDVDPDRQGLLPFAWKPGATFRDYIEWALDIPMFLVLRGDEVLENTGQTFRTFMREGLRGERATMADWLTHLNTLFPEVRLKKTIEFRGADSLPVDLMTGPAAVWTGILGDDRSLDEADTLTESFNHEEVVALRANLVKEGVLARFRGERVADMGLRIVSIARGGLERRNVVDGDRRETHFLSAVEALLNEGRTPADRLLARKGTVVERLDAARLVPPPVV